MLMFYRVLILCAVTLWSESVAAQIPSTSKPPNAIVREVTDTYFGINIVDPYRWMEDGKSSETQAWMKAQADYARAYLDRVRPDRIEIRNRES
jgi:prolyl oligopeptidase